MLKLTIFLLVFLAFSGCDKPEKKPRGVNLSGYEQHLAQKESPQQHSKALIKDLQGGKIVGNSSSSIIKKRKKKRIF